MRIHYFLVHALASSRTYFVYCLDLHSCLVQMLTPSHDQSLPISNAQDPYLFGL